MAAGPEVPEGVEAGQEKDKDAKEQEYRKRHQYREGQTQLEIISTSVERHQLIDAGRNFMNGFEDMSLHPDGSVSEYRLEDTIAVVGNRKSDMSYSCQDLRDLGYLVKRRDENGNIKLDKKGDPIEDLVFLGFAYTSKIEVLEHRKKILDPHGLLLHTEVEEEPIQTFVAGKDEDRENLYKGLAQVQSEMTAREDLVKKLRFLWGQTENLEGLVQFYYMGSLTADAMGDLCDAEGRSIPHPDPKESMEGKRVAVLTKTEGGAEYRKRNELGDATSAALQCLEIAALSEKPAELEALLKRPGIKFLFNVTDKEIDELFLTDLEIAKQKNLDGSPRKRIDNANMNMLYKWIGRPWLWEQRINGPKENVKEDNEQSLRGLFTKHGNILVESEWEGAEKLFQNIERFLIGGDGAKSILAKKDARDACFIAWGLLRTTAMATDLGGQVYHYDADELLKRDPGNYVAHEMGAMTSCDRIKVIGPNIFRNVYRFLKPEIRGFGPDGSLGKYPDRFTVPYFKAWSVDVKYVDEEKTKWIKPDSGEIKRSLGKRTFDEMRWGYRADKQGEGTVDLLTGSKVLLPEEPAYRLGELPWDKLSPKAYNVAALGPYIAGREKIGIFQHIMRTDYHIEELKEKSFFEKLAQYTGICFNEQTVWNGKLRGIYNGEKPAREGEKSHDDKVKNEMVKNKIRDYKKKFFSVFWDGIRSLPQYREWLAGRTDETKDSARGGSAILIDPIKRIKYRLGKIGIFTMDEAMKLPTDALIKDEFA